MPKKQEELPGVEGPGVSQPKFKDLDRLGDKFITLRDEKAELATKLTKVEGDIIDCMTGHGLTTYKFSDQVMLINPGKTHVKIKTVKVRGEEPEPDEED